ncbi:VWA domain-containing protein [Acidiferrimicrobium sp. IK]|nr:VWA domain-containing protein [Acidiferrimicrobium sp. IK]
MLETLAGFVTELRRAGIPVSLTENLDAMEALRHVPIEDRSAFKYALAATMVKNNAHWKAFETVFEVYFSFRGSHYRLKEDETDDGGIESMLDELTGTREGEGGSGEGLSAEELAEMLYRALMDGNDALLRALARAAVTRYAGMEPGRPVGGTYYLYRTLRQLDLEGLLERMMGEAESKVPDQQLTELEERLAREEYQARLDALRREVESEIRRRLVADRGAEAVARAVRKPLPEDIDFMHASRDELVSLRKAIAPLTRKLAVRLARKRRHGRKGPLDFRSTVRHSLSTGGVPADPQFRYPRPSKPEIMVIADISGSVAAFARFTLQMVYAISSQFSRVRSFVFIDGIDEVTDYFKSTEDIAHAIHRINTEADVIWVDGHSDYGHALETYWERWGKEISGKTTVLLLGDARNNYHASQSWVVAEMAKKARHVYWLNPEPKSYWDTGDSIVGQYAAHCDGAYECRNLKQLERFVEQLG